MSNDLAEKILAEIQSLRQEVALLVPTESLAEYENGDEIVDALASARAELAS